MRTCDRCGVALASSQAGTGRRLSLVADNGHMTTVDLCSAHYGEVLRAMLETLLGKSERVSESVHAR